MEQDNDSPEHLSLERISALLDEPGGDPEAAEHLERCERCEREHERMRRMRMALSALDGVAPPEDQWEEIEPHLPEREVDSGLDDEEEGVIPLLRSGSVAQLAAATLVFAVGLSAGLQLRGGATSGPGSGEPDSREARVRSVESGGESGGAGALGGPGEEARTGTRLAASADGGASTLRRGGGYASAARSLVTMVDGRPDTTVEPFDDPVAAAEEMARLEALAEAAREALRERPADPALNNFLFRVNERQQSLRSRLGAAARLASMDFR